MNIKVKYFTKTGNTKKLADRIARTVGVHAETVENGKDLKDAETFAKKIIENIMSESR